MFVSFDLRSFASRKFVNIHPLNTHIVLKYKLYDNTYMYTYIRCHPKKDNSHFDIFGELWKIEGTFHVIRMRTRKNLNCLTKTRDTVDLYRTSGIDVSGLGRRDSCSVASYCVLPGSSLVLHLLDITSNSFVSQVLRPLEPLIRPSCIISSL